MYMMYTVSGFRKNIRQALNDAERDEMVAIKKFNKIFIVSLTTKEDYEDILREMEEDRGVPTKVEAFQALKQQIGTASIEEPHYEPTED